MPPIASAECAKSPAERQTHGRLGWRFKYVLTEVTCKHCGAKFPHTKLQEDYIGNEYGEGTERRFVNICPQCAIEASCTLRYERIETVVRTMEAPEMKKKS